MKYIEPPSKRRTQKVGSLPKRRKPVEYTIIRFIVLAVAFIIILGLLYR